MKMNKKFIHIATGVFTLNVIVVLALYLVFERGFNLNWTISRYMGTSVWSAILFGLTNLIVIFCVLKYLLRIQKLYKLSSFWGTLVIAMIITYLGLSICPVGLFDPTWGEFGIVSRMHHFFSYTMFVIMAVIVLDTLIEVRRGKSFVIFGASLILYMIGCIFCYKYGTSFFMNNILLFESGYILANLVFYSLIPKKSDIIE
ncbi:MAG: hypothetical protein Q4A33_02150 [Candidatus Saccharibacteria bacterium]|nr:hypothetical protein [Candidatus Saccharibacteria bacterium]